MFEYPSNRLLLAAMPRTKDNSQSREVRLRLLHAAGEVFAEHGFRAATVRQITERAGVNLAAINYHFRDKGELYACALHAAHARARSIPLPSPDGPAPVRLRAFVASTLTYLLDPARPAWQSRLMARELAEPTPALEGVIDENIRPRCDCLRGILRDAAGKPGLSPETLGLFTNSVMGQCLHYSQNRAVIRQLSPELGDYTQRIELLADHITACILPALRQASRRPAAKPTP